MVTGQARGDARWQSMGAQVASLPATNTELTKYFIIPSFLWNVMAILILKFVEDRFKTPIEISKHEKFEFIKIMIKICEIGKFCIN